MHRLRNNFEKKIYLQLRKSKVKFDYEAELIPYILSRNYIPDFIITTPTGKKIYIECKGYLRPEDKSKMVAVRKMHPDKDFRILFYSNNKKNFRWAEKNGFLYAVENVPKEWLI